MYNYIINICMSLSQYLVTRSDFVNFSVLRKPTFTIIKEYNGELPLYHMDVYRLDGNTDGIGIEEYFTKKGVCIIEWSDLIEDILPKNRLDIKIKIVGEEKRIFIVTPHGKKYEELCEAAI